MLNLGQEGRMGPGANAEECHTLLEPLLSTIRHPWVCPNAHTLQHPCLSGFSTFSWAQDISVFVWRPLVPNLCDNKVIPLK